jgi:hypothetical protein
MIWEAPIAFHAALYRYWTEKRGDRPMPDKGAIDPADLKPLLPNIGIIERHPGGYRWRLMGTAITDDMGRDLTGQALGDYVGDRALVRRMTATYDRALGEARAIFEESAYRSAALVPHSVSRLILPLASGGRPSMVIFTRITRQLRDERVERDWLKGAVGAVRGTFDIASLDALEARARAWEKGAAASS